MLTEFGRKRDLKFTTWEWYVDRKTLRIINKISHDHVDLDKVRAVSLMRFLISVLQNPKSKRRKYGRTR